MNPPLFFFFNDTATTEIYTLALHDALPIFRHGLVTYPGLPGPEITDHLSRETSAGVYGPDTSFHIGRISMVANTGTYLDSPFHRFATGADLSGIPIERLADLEGIVVDANGQRGIERERVRVHEVRGKAVLLHTGWDRHWETP